MKKPMLWREQAGLSVMELALLLKVPVADVVAYERTGKPSLAILDRLVPDYPPEVWRLGLASRRLSVLLLGG